MAAGRLGELCETQDLIFEGPPYAQAVEVGLVEGRENRHGENSGGLFAAVGGAGSRAPSCSLEHRAAARCVDGHELCSDLCGRAARALDLGRDVVELQVEEDVEAAIPELADEAGSR